MHHLALVFRKRLALIRRTTADLSRPAVRTSQAMQESSPSSLLAFLVLHPSAILVANSAFAHGVLLQVDRTSQAAMASYRPC
jgi:hypothetical protein